MAAAVVIGSNGDITVDGKIITPEEAAKAGGIVLADVHKAVTALHNKTLLSWKNGEKAILYLAGVIGASNGFSWLTMPSGVREWLVGGAAFALGAIHISTPVKTN